MKTQKKIRMTIGLQINHERIEIIKLKKLIKHKEKKIKELINI